MRKIFTIASALVFGAASLQAQTVATFDTLTLPGTDTFYVNFDDPGNDVGFEDGLAHFETVYDTAWGLKSLSRGFIYSNMTDSVTSGYVNANSAKTAIGYNGSSQYAVGYGYDVPISVTLKGDARGKLVRGFYATNTTYAFNSMRDGDAFAKKFGGVPNVDEDWFKLTVKGFLNDSLKEDTVAFYLADFRNADSTKDYIVNTWEWVDLTPLGDVDSLTFQLSSSDVGQWGTNTPLYFCMDNFVTNFEEPGSVKNTQKNYAAKVYPNPATDKLYVEAVGAAVNEVIITGISGNLVGRFKTTDKVTLINTANYVPGIYLVQLVGENGTASVRFVKQ